jgi:hypothetical protein
MSIWILKISGVTYERTFVNSNVISVCTIHRLRAFNIYERAFVNSCTFPMFFGCSKCTFTNARSYMTFILSVPMHNRIWVYTFMDVKYTPRRYLRTHVRKHPTNLDISHPQTHARTEGLRTRVRKLLHIPNVRRMPKMYIYERSFVYDFHIVCAYA